MKKLYRWEQIVLIILAILSFIAGFNIGIIDGIMALAINTLILYVVFLVGNLIYKKATKKS